MLKTFLFVIFINVILKNVLGWGNRYLSTTVRKRCLDQAPFCLGVFYPSSIHILSFVLCGDLFEEINLIIFFFHLYYSIWCWAQYVVGIRENSAMNGQFWEPLLAGILAGPEMSSLTWMWRLSIILCACPVIQFYNTSLHFTTHRNTLDMGERAYRQIHTPLHACASQCCQVWTVTSFASETSPTSPVIHAPSRAHCTQTHQHRHGHHYRTAPVHMCAVCTHAAAHTLDAFGAGTEAGSTLNPGRGGSHNTSYKRKKFSLSTGDCSSTLMF